MPLYHLDIRDGDDLAIDVEGDQHPHLDAARTSAVATAKELLAIALREGEGLENALLKSIEIRVGSDVVATITFAEANGLGTT